MLRSGERYIESARFSLGVAGLVSIAEAKIITAQELGRMIARSCESHGVNVAEVARAMAPEAPADRSQAPPMVRTPRDHDHTPT